MEPEGVKMNTGSPFQYLTHQWRREPHAAGVPHAVRGEDLEDELRKRRALQADKTCLVF
jgi:hypothetical protein